MSNRWLGLTLLLAGCFHGGLGLPQPARAGDPGGKSIIQLLDYTSELAWRSSPYYRAGDGLGLDWPIRVAIGGDGLGCILAPAWWAIAKVGDFLDCPAGWRFSRP